MTAFSDWQTLLAMQGGAAATLTGLVFVAVSLNLTKIIEVPGLPGRAAESITQLMQAFLASAVILIPRQPVWVLGIELIVLTACSWALQLATQIAYARKRKGHPRAWFLVRFLLTQFATLPFGVAGIGLCSGRPALIYWTLPGFLFSFVAAVMSAWVLLIEILR